MDSISRISLFKQLATSVPEGEHREMIKRGKLPLDLKIEIEDMPLFNRRGECILHADVIVKPSVSTTERRVMEHRIFVICPNCDREMPFGRMHQHMGTKACHSDRASGMPKP